MSATLGGSERVSPKTAATETEEPQRDNNIRDARGRCPAGNVGGPGNPFARRVAEFRQVLAANQSNFCIISRRWSIGN
jgi:hypothetical protein